MDLNNKITLSLILCTRNDEYMGNSRWRLETTVNLTIENAIKSNCNDQIEILIADWGSEVPLSKEVSFIQEAEKVVSLVYIPPEIAESEQKDSNFPEVLALNAVARRSRGEFIGRIDNDTVIGEGFFRNFFSLVRGETPSNLQLENSYLFVERRMVPYRLSSKSLPLPLISSYLQKFGSYLLVESARRFNKPFWQSPVGIMLMHRSIWEAARGYDQRLLYWGWMESDFVLRIQEKNPIVDFKEYVGNHFFHLEHYHHMTDYQNRNGLATPRKKNETISDGKEYCTNDENWGLIQYSLKKIPYTQTSINNWKDPRDLSSLEKLTFIPFLIKLFFQIKIDNWMLNGPSLNDCISKLRIWLGWIKNKMIHKIK